MIKLFQKLTQQMYTISCAVNRVCPVHKEALVPFGSKDVCYTCEDEASEKAGKRINWLNN